MHVNGNFEGLLGLLWLISLHWADEPHFWFGFQGMCSHNQTGHCFSWRKGSCGSSDSDICKTFEKLKGKKIRNSSSLQLICVGDVLPFAEKKKIKGGKHSVSLSLLASSLEHNLAFHILANRSNKSNWNFFFSCIWSWHALSALLFLSVNNLYWNIGSIIIKNFGTNMNEILKTQEITDL